MPLESYGFPLKGVFFGQCPRQKYLLVAILIDPKLMRMVEAGTVKLDKFRVLNQQYEKDSALPLSTRLYPEWPFATLKNTSRELATHVAQALLSMPADHPTTCQNVSI